MARRGQGPGKERPREARGPREAKRDQGPGKEKPGARPRDIHGYGPCFGMNENPRRATDVILRQSKAQIEFFNSR